LAFIPNRKTAKQTLWLWGNHTFGITVMQILATNIWLQPIVKSNVYVAEETHLFCNMIKRVMQRNSNIDWLIV
jgi:hypothetical protein